MKDTFEPLTDDQAWMYASEPAPAEDREYDDDHEQWLTRHSER